MRAYVVLGLFLTIPLASGTLQPHSEAQYWSESYIQLSFVQTLINNQKCGSSNLYRDACLRAFKVANDLTGGAHPHTDSHFSESLAAIAAAAPTKIPKEMIYGRMVDTLVQRFDAHGHVVPTEYNRASHSIESSTYFGVGVRNSVSAAGLFVHQVFPQSPAERAGIHIGDRIVSVDGHKIGGGEMARRQSELIVGSLGSFLSFEIERAHRLIWMRVQIGIVSIAHFESHVLASHLQDIGYLRVDHFVHGTCEEVRARIRRMRAQVHGLVLDLRDNPGGLIDEAVCMAELFAGPQRVVGQKLVRLEIPLDLKTRTVRGDEPMDWVDSTVAAEFEDLPLVILIDQGSASAAELLAAALQDSRRAWLVGERSFGKGTMQSAETLKANPDLTVIYTVSIFYRSNKTTNQLAGVRPDFEIPFRRGAGKSERIFEREKELFPWSLKPPGENPDWIQPRRPEVQRLNTCLAARSAEEFEDYQLDRALALLSCPKL